MDKGLVCGWTKQSPVRFRLVGVHININQAKGPFQVGCLSWSNEPDHLLCLLSSVDTTKGIKKKVCVCVCKAANVPFTLETKISFLTQQ